MAVDQVKWRQMPVRFKTEQLSKDVVERAVQDSDKTYSTEAGKMGEDYFIALANDNETISAILAKDGKPALPRAEAPCSDKSPAGIQASVTRVLDALAKCFENVLSKKAA